MASVCGRMALRAAARQNVTYTPVRFCKSKFFLFQKKVNFPARKNEAPIFDSSFRLELEYAARIRGHDSQP